MPKSTWKTILFVWIFLLVISLVGIIANKGSSQSETGYQESSQTFQEILNAPSKSSLGVPREAVREYFDKLTSPGVRFTFNPEQALQDGVVRVMGANDYGVMIELIGPEHDLTEATITVPLVKGPQATVNSIMIVGLLQAVFPDWPNPIEWVTGVAQSQKETVIISRNGHLVLYRFYPSLAMVHVSIKGGSGEK